MSFYEWDDQEQDQEVFADEVSMAQGDPPPILSNNPPTPLIVFRKELTGYPNYGNPSGNADILYTGNRGEWTLTLPAFFNPVIRNARIIRLVISGALDDHYNTPENRYSANITFNGRRVETGRLPLVHGRPAGTRFENWHSLIVQLPRNLVRASNRIVITNTSTATNPDDFIALDWIELRFFL